MVLGTRADGSGAGSKVISESTIREISDILENHHSVADICAALKECDMNPDRAVEKLLNQDTFHEVKRRGQRKKELTGYNDFSDTRKHVEHTVLRAKSYTSWDRNGQRGSYSRNSVTDAGGRQFRVVKDNRVNQDANKSDKQETVQQSATSIKQTSSNVPDNNSSRHPTDKKHPNGTNSNSYILSVGLNKPSAGSLCAKDENSSGNRRPLLHGESQAVVSISKAQRLSTSSAADSKITSNNSVSGVYTTSSDPVHVPSSDARPAGTVGAIRREVGVVGYRRESSDWPVTHSSVSNSSFSTHLLGKDIPLQAASSGHLAVASKSNQLSQVAAEVPIIPSFMNRSAQGSHQINKAHQSSLGNQKVMHTNMEWKPKVRQKANVVSPSVVGADSAAPSCADNSCSSDVGNNSGLTEKPSQINNFENQHVIIPQNLRVLESELTRLTFGSFGAGFGSAKELSSAKAECLADEPSASKSASVLVGFNVDTFLSNQEDNVNGQVRTSQSDTASISESMVQLPLNDISISQNIESYDDVGLVQSNSPPYSSTEGHPLQNDPSFSSFSAYDNQTSYDVPFFRTVMADNVRAQGLVSSPEALNFHGASSSPLSMMAVAQQQQAVQQQQQPIAQVYPQVQIPSYPNFVPYRHIFSPIYVPPMALPNYSSNHAFTHPNGNSYLLLSGGNSHLNSGSMKYAVTQYKPVPSASPTGYGIYSNPAGFTLNTPGAISNATGLEDLNRIKYKDNNLYAPNPLAETSNIWIQTPEELPSLQSAPAPYYNLSGQAPHAAFVPAHASHAFNAPAQTSHMQYPGMHHPQQSSSLGSHHHLVHQQVPSALGGNVGAGVAIPGPQVGTYQQPQLGHLNWTANF